MTRPHRNPALLLVLSLAASCATGHGARTAGKGNVEIAASVGGPVFHNVGPTIPLPLAHLGAHYGLTEELDAAAGFHAMAAAYGTVGADVGARYQLWKGPAGAALAASALLNVFVGTRDGAKPRVFPELGLHGQWPIGGRFVALGGVDALAQLDPPEDKPFLFAAPYLGAERRIGGASAVALTVGWISPWQDSTSVIDYAPGTLGAFTVQVGYRRLFDGGSR